MKYRSQNFLYFDQYLISSKIYKPSENGNKTTFQDAAANTILFDVQLVAAQNLKFFPLTKMLSF